MSVSLDTMLARVAGNISRYNMFPTGCRVGVAVSGGADSMCLLHVLIELAPRWNLHLSVVHVEHGIRGAASREDADFVRRVAAEFGLPFHCRSADLPEITKRTRDNLEQAARQVRMSFFSELMLFGAVDRIATAHTRDDQAETVLFRLLRGSGTAGFAGIYPCTAEGLVRPLLDISRNEVEDYLRTWEIGWHEDASNSDLSYTRNRIRRELIPMLADRYNPQINEALVRTALMAREDEEYWDATVPSPVVEHGVILLTAAEVANMQPAMARRLIRKVIKSLKGDLRQVGFEHVDAMLQLASAPKGSGRFRFGAIEVWRSFDWVRFSAYSPGQRPEYELPITVPGEIGVEEAKLRLQFNLQAASARACATVRAELNWDRTLGLMERSGDVLRIRNWRPGDRYCPTNGREEKIKQMFQDHRVPIWERAGWPVLTVAGQIIWSRHFGTASGFEPDESTSVVLVIDDDYVAPV